MSGAPLESGRADVAILGGGPAGLSTALALAGRGARVLVAERSRYGEDRFGETFPPAVQTALAPLGLWESFAASGALPSVGIRSVWGRSEPYEKSFLFNPYGPGWHVDRRAFDAALAFTAEARGVRIARGARLLACERGTDHGWRLRFGSDDGDVEIEARFLVDATGRASTLARRLGAVRIAGDRLVAVAGYGEPVPGARSVEEVALIEAAEDGWWYSAPLPGGRLVAAFLTDADLWPAGKERDAARWHAARQSSPCTAERTASFTFGELRTVSANSSWLASSCGPDWLAVGDAALAWDPLSGNGVQRALEAGPKAAEVILATLGGDPEALPRHGREMAGQLAAYLAVRGDYYRRETRWKGSSFWERRHSGTVGGTTC